MIPDCLTELLCYTNCQYPETQKSCSHRNRIFGAGRKGAKWKRKPGLVLRTERISKALFWLPEWRPHTMLHKLSTRNISNSIKLQFYKITSNHRTSIHVTSYLNSSDDTSYISSPCVYKKCLAYLQYHLKLKNQGIIEFPNESCKL